MNASGCVYLSVVGAVITHAQAIAATPLPYQKERRKSMKRRWWTISTTMYIQPITRTNI